MTARFPSAVAFAVVLVVALVGCSGGDAEPVKQVASKACGLISDKALREITGDRELYESQFGSGGYRYIPSDPRPLFCTASAPNKPDRTGESYVFISAINMDQVREVDRELNRTRPDNIDRSTKREIREMRRDRSCSRLVTFPKHIGYICDEKAGKRLTNAFVVPNDRRQVTFFFYSSIDQSVATPENVLRWAKDVDRTIAKQDKLAAEEAKKDNKD